MMTAIKQGCKYVSKYVSYISPLKQRYTKVMQKEMLRSY